MGKRALEIEADTFAFFTRNPRGGKSKKADPEDAAKLREIMAQNGFGKLVAHAPYTMNACSKDERVREFARMCMKEHLDEVLEEFDRCIGLSKLKALHINDSMNPLGAHKDRHARIGEGTIGKEGMVKILCHPALQGLPCILETPQKDLQGYGAEIRMLREAIRERNSEKEENR